MAFTKYPIEDWKYEVANDDTQLGYIDWCEQKSIEDDVQASEELEGLNKMGPPETKIVYEQPNKKETDKLIATAHENILRRKGNPSYAPNAKEIQEEINKLVKKLEPPMFVRMGENGCCLRKVGEQYWRDGGYWGIEFTNVAGDWCSVPDEHFPDSRELFPVTEAEWRECNSPHDVKDPYKDNTDVQEPEEDDKDIIVY